jgi:N-formylmaleamate deformylase
LKTKEYTVAAWQTGDVITNGIRMHYTRTGGDKPSLVLAHGFSDDGLCWSLFAKALEADFDIVMIDARSHGRSEAPDADTSPEVQAHDCAGLIKALGLNKPIVLGHSMGAVMTLALSGLYPDLIAGAILEDPPEVWVKAIADERKAQEQQQSDLKNAPSFAGWLGELRKKTREQMIADQLAATPHWGEEEINYWADSKVLIHPNALRAAYFSIDWDSIIPNVRVPSLLISADPSRGGLVTPEGAEQLQARIASLQVAHIGDAGHCIRRDQPAEYEQLVRKFIEQVLG